MSDKPYILGLGEMLWDIYPDAKYPGGAPANVALHVRNLGAEAAILSAVGQDDLGDALLREFSTRGVDCTPIQRNRHPTGTVQVTLNASGIPSFQCSQDVAFDYIKWDKTVSRLIKKVDAIVFGTLAQRNRESRATIQRMLNTPTNALKVYDVNFRGWNASMADIVDHTLLNCDIVKMNNQELDQLRTAYCQSNLSEEQFLQWMIEKFNLRMATLTLGPDGCVLADRKNIVREKGMKIQPVDTTGCGDAFVAALTIKVLQNISLEETADFSNLIGAYVATLKGASPKYSIEMAKKLLINLN